MDRLSRQTDPAQTCLEYAFNDYYAAIRRQDAITRFRSKNQNDFNETLQVTCDEALNTANSCRNFHPGPVQRAFEIAEAGGAVLFSGSVKAKRTGITRI